MSAWTTVAVKRHTLRRVRALAVRLNRPGNKIADLLLGRALDQVESEFNEAAVLEVGVEQVHPKGVVSQG